MRETLFNWLQWDVGGARCIELYAGSGILGIEALSRGATFVTFVERDAETAAAIGRNLAALGAPAGTFECVATTVDAYLRQPAAAPVSIVLLDPPFDGGEINRILPQLPALLADDALVYVESPARIAAAELPDGFQIHRQKRAGQVHYALLRFTR